MAPASIPGGSSYAAEIENAIAGCKVFVLLLSEAAMNSKWVEKELDRAISRDKLVLPLRTSDFELNPQFSFYLSNVQFYDINTDYSRVMLRLIERLNNEIYPSCKADNSRSAPSNNADSGSDKSDTAVTLIYDKNNITNTGANATNAAPQNAQQQGHAQVQTSSAPSSKKVGFGRAIKLFFTNYVNFTGRASRREFWFGFLFQILVILLTIGIPFIRYLVPLALIIPNLSLKIRRLHDIGQAWYWLLIVLVPVAGIVVLIVYYCQGSDGNNKWGPGPAGYGHPVYSNSQNA